MKQFTYLCSCGKTLGVKGETEEEAIEQFPAGWVHGPGRFDCSCPQCGGEWATPVEPEKTGKTRKTRKTGKTGKKAE